MTTIQDSIKNINKSLGELSLTEEQKQLIPSVQTLGSSLNSTLASRNLPKLDLSRLEERQLKVNAPVPSPIPSIPSLDSLVSGAFKSTPTQGKQDQILGNITDLSGQLVKESQFRTQEEDRQDVSGKRQQLNDLTNRFNTIAAEQQAIPLQIQQEFEGRGTTRAGIEPIQTSRLRNNAIQALSVGASLQAAQGNLATALDLVDRAVNAEFDPIRAEIEAQRLNLQALEPQLNREEKQRATALELQLNERERLLNKQETTKSQVLKLMVTAAEAGADSTTLRDIQNANSVEEATTIAQPFLKDDAKTQVVDINGSKRLINSQTGETIRVLGGNSSSTSPQSIVTSKPKVVVNDKEVSSFDEFVKQKEEELQQSLTPKAQEAYRDEYEELVATAQNQAELESRESRINTLSPTTREVYLNPSLYFGFTATERKKIITEVANAGLDTQTISKGKKTRLSATQSDDFVQAQIALNNVQRIGRLFDDLGETGPGIGQFRNANPFDDRVVELNNLITQTVPGLARGIFKEVGVLTDQDVSRYTQTLANPKLTKEQAETAISQLLETIGFAIQTQQETYEALGYDLGTFNIDIESQSGDELSDSDAYELYLQQTNQ